MDNYYDVLPLHDLIDSESYAALYVQNLHHFFNCQGNSLNFYFHPYQICLYGLVVLLSWLLLELVCQLGGHLFFEILSCQ